MGDQVITDTGIPTMNVDNKLSNKSLLFGLIAESAQTNRLFVVLNRLIKAQSADAMVIPMNIRPDDLYFTVSNLKKSHVNGSYIAQEYVTDVMETLDEQNVLVAKSGGCDFVLREGERLLGRFHLPEAVSTYVTKAGFNKIAIVGDNALSRALSLTLSDQELYFFHPEIEAIMRSSQAVGVELDINRIDNDIAVDLSGFDLIINTMDETLFEKTIFAKTLLDLGHVAAFRVATKAISEQNGVTEYRSFDDLLDDLAAIIFKNYIKD